MNDLKIYLTLLLGFIFLPSFGQDVYKTPSGKKYHLATCRMVETVSDKLLNKQDIFQYNLTPCKICKPPPSSQLKFNTDTRGKAVGKSVSVRCKGYTQEGTHCKHNTRNANGYCYQHTSQNSAPSYSIKSSTTTSSSSTCGAKNKTGGFCKRKVKGGGRCYQHE